jgi:hypothetical protein
MKKLLVLMMVLALAAPAAVMAADNLSVSGQIRIRTWDKENFTDFSDTAANDTSTDKAEYVGQRFRMQAVVKATDNVKGVLRLDFAEDKWGSSNWATHRYNENSELQVDRAYLDINLGPVNVKAGQQFMAVGQSQVIRNNKPGVQVTIKTPVVVELGYSVEQDSDVLSQPGGADESNLHLSVGYKSDVFSVEGFYGQQVTSNAASATQDNEDTKMVYGVDVKTSVGPVKINSELAFFGGDNEATNVDYVGTQFNVDADMKLSDMVKIGVDLIYSTGTDDTATEDKIAYIGDPFGKLNRSEGGSGNNIIDGDLSPIGADDVFDPFSQNLGAWGGGVDVVITPVAGLDLLAHIMYLTSQEDAPTGSGLWDDALVYNLGVTYMLAPKAKVGLYYTVVDADFEGGGDSDAASNIGGLLQISF